MSDDWQERSSNIRVEGERMGKREERMFWTTSLRHVRGFSCAGHTFVWWVPEEGASLWEDIQIFSDREKARQAGIKQLLQEIDEKKSNLERLKRA